MDLTVATNDLDLGIYEENILYLEKYSPETAIKVKNAELPRNYQIKRTDKGLPVVVNKGIPMNSLEDPIQEAFDIFEKEKSNTSQRYLVFGIGTGYQLIPVIASGYSAIVYDPDVASLKLACTLVDLTKCIPFTTFHFESELPDLPRNMKILVNQQTKNLYEDIFQRMMTQYIDHLPEQVDFETGVYYGTYRNVTCLKNPIDHYVYQMMIFEIRPTLLIEIGVLRGGSTLFFADMMRLLGGERRIYAYDIVKPHTPELFKDPMITFFSGGHDDFDPSIIRPDDRVLIIEDSSHEYQNTLNVLNKFAPYVSPKSYLIVEDTMSGLTRPHQNGGPIRAIDEFLKTDIGKNYVVDSYWENFFGSNISNNQKGFLKKVS